jgi:hypothetical protein
VCKVVTWLWMPATMRGRFDHLWTLSLMPMSQPTEALPCTLYWQSHPKNLDISNMLETVYDQLVRESSWVCMAMCWP